MGSAASRLCAGEAAVVGKPRCSETALPHGKDTRWRGRTAPRGARHRAKRWPRTCKPTQPSEDFSLRCLLTTAAEKPQGKAALGAGAITH